jgi:chromate transporter
MTQPDLATLPLSQRLGELAQLFLKLGTFGFGGPQAHIAMQNDEVVVRHQWLTQEEFTEGLAVCEILPGPASTQLGIYIGYHRAGAIGALVSGFCFIAPAFLILLALTWVYFQFQTLPQVSDLFLGVSPVISAIILSFCWKLSRKTLRHWTGGAIAILTFLVILILKLNIFLAFLIAGAIGIIVYRPGGPLNPSHSQSSRAKRSGNWFLPVLPAWSGTTLLAVSSSPSTTVDVLTLSSVWGWERIQIYALPLITFFLKVGSFIFGGGLVIIPLLEYQVVEQFHWLTRTEFINGVALGQLTPGPVVLTAAFVGYKVAGVLGALTATIAIFAPSFAFILLAAPLLQRIRHNPWIRAFLLGVTSAVIGAIAAASIPLLMSALVHDSWVLVAGTSLIGVLALVALLRYKVPTWQLIPVSALLGLGLGAIA